MIWVLLTLCLLLLGLSVFLGAALFRFVRIMIVLEDSLPEVIEAHSQTSKTLEILSAVPYMTENKAAADQLRAALDDVMICSIATGKLATALTKWSKQNYVRIEEE